MPTTDEYEHREQAFLALIRYAESAQHERPDAYNLRNGGTQFFDMSHHPGRAKGALSSASGACQIVEGTARALAKQYGIRDFSPASQDLMALMIIRQQGATVLVNELQLHAAFAKLRGQWISLPCGSQQRSPRRKPRRTSTESSPRAGSR